MKKAFTLIELLIVIAIIGILAVAILIALDPIEQTNRAIDVKLVTASGEIRGAIKNENGKSQGWKACRSCTVLFPSRTSTTLAIFVFINHFHTIFTVLILHF